MWPDNFCKGSPLPVGRVDLSVVASGYSHSGFAIVDSEPWAVKPATLVVVHPYIVRAVWEIICKHLSTSLKAGSAVRQRKCIARLAFCKRLGIPPFPKKNEMQVLRLPTPATKTCRWGPRLRFHPSEQQSLAGDPGALRSG
jgi:hypothetical protein